MLEKNDNSNRFGHAEHVNKVVDRDFAKTASENAKIDIEVEMNRYGIRIDIILGNTDDG